MARRRGSRTRTVGVDLNKLTHESRAFLLDAGMESVALLAEKIAAQANENAKTAIKHAYPPLKGQAERRGPNKSGGSDSGPIQDSVFAQESQKVPNSYLVVAPAWYAHFVEYGTDPHDMPRISSKKGHTMVFRGTNDFEGQTIGVKEVHHPGAKRHPFLRPAADKADDFVKQIAKEMGFDTKP